MSDSPVSLSRSGPPETVLEPEPAELVTAIAAAKNLDPVAAKAAVGQIVADNPASLLGWAELGDLADDVIEAYAYFRVGYHRGLDKLRQSGWRGSGFVRWSHESNRGFLRALAGLAASAAAIGEAHEAERCELFLRQLDPGWPETTT